EGRLALFIDGVADFTGSGVENDLDKLIRASTREGQFVVGENESASWSQAYVLAQPFKEDRRGLLLQPSDMDGDSLLGTSLGRIRRADFPAGRGLLVHSGSALKLQVAQVTYGCGHAQPAAARGPWSPRAPSVTAGAGAVIPMGTPPHGPRPRTALE